LSSAHNYFPSTLLLKKALSGKYAATVKQFSERSGDCRIYLFGSLAARVFNKLTRYSWRLKQTMRTI